MTTSRTWLVLFDHAEIERRYQWPVSVERVLAEHVAAVAAVPITEGMDTSAAPIAAHAADTQAGEAGIAGPQKEARHTGSLDRSDAPAPERARGVHHRANRQGWRAGHCGSPAEGRRARAVLTALPDSFPAPLTCCLFPTMSHENNQVRRPEIAGIRRSQFPVHTPPQTGPAMLPDLSADLEDHQP